MDTVTVLTPTIPGREAMLRRALESVASQKRQPDNVIVMTDQDRAGAIETRNLGLERVRTEWVAFLDDDDELLPHHLRNCLAWAEKSGADVVYPGCRVFGPDGREMKRPWQAGRFGKPFDPDLLRKKSYIPVTSLVRTRLAKQVGGFSYPEGSGYEDWGLYLKLLDAGAVFSHLPVITWFWHHHGDNTSGKGLD